ncbi:MAG: ABC transporter ATP-binding protein [Hyphomicrobiales bacterium]|nr:ABC transporter ATP-binding protein [Hyphomicrobiales bacterium]
MLQVSELHMRFGGIRAVDGVTLDIPAKSITGLIGPNGAGKTTLFNVMAGLHKPTAGRVVLNGEDITGRKPHERFHKGLVRTFQLPHEFTSLTVRENLMVVSAGQSGEKLWQALFRRNRIDSQERAIVARAETVLGFLELTHVAGERAGNLSGGQRKLLELARIMMAGPSVVLLDEISAGVNRTLLNKIGGSIRRLNREMGLTFCLIEHDIEFVASLCGPVIVMAEGRVLMQGDINAVKANETVIEAYLGRGSPEAAGAID